MDAGQVVCPISPSSPFMCPWWCHQMETFSALLAICWGNSPVPGEFPAQRPVRRSFDVFFNLRLNKQLSKQSWGWWFEMLSHPLWRHCNAQTLSVTHEHERGQRRYWTLCHLGIALSWMPQNFTNEKTTLVQEMALCHQATSHFLSQGWCRFMSPYGITGQQLEYVTLMPLFSHCHDWTVL